MASKRREKHTASNTEPLLPGSETSRETSADVYLLTFGAKTDISATVTLLYNRLMFLRSSRGREYCHRRRERTG
jgi:hypothetical protein